ncbi:GDSL esterase/lipase At2g36325 [Cryptomeria japonica]|uniref:GDSL esterase/lipase At2g36325 n=1 Tax=Cryptomeria japonica TaxID=3369 RepID=UPI0027DAA86C|nr:GDSL esterase/lipase At2g36325 [Cryptomeria japonica]
MKMVAKMPSALLVFLPFFLLSVIGICSGDQTTAFFAFGDSYADTGNYHPPMNNSIVSAWKYPYGITWPGHPSGRVSSGRILTDYLAQILGLPSPVTYRVLNSSTQHIVALQGINFAISYSGVFDSFGVPKLSVQVGNLKDTIISQKYDSHHLKHSIVLLTLNGNDYAAANVSAVGTEKFVKSVITEMKLQLTELYNLGLRNFLVSNNMPFDCQPGYLQSGAVCFNTTMELVSTHNNYLSKAISELSKLEDANFLILDFFAAFSHITLNPFAYGIHEMSRSCCSRDVNMSSSAIGCADYDEQGRALFHLCKSREEFFFFDWYHPTQKGWQVMINLHYSHSGFVQDGSSSPFQSLAEWLSERVGLDSYPPKFSQKSIEK